MRRRIPQLVLIDAQGEVVYDAVGPNDDTLRTQIAKLGPEYASVAPKTPLPCPASD